MNKLSKIVGHLIICHLIISLTFIFFPAFLQETQFSKIYNRYLLPGPFFTDSRIGESNYLNISWKKDNCWTSPINPSLDNYENYFSSVNPVLLYRSRWERSLYQNWIAVNESTEEVTLEENLKRYYKERYVPSDSDSVMIVVIRKKTYDFRVEYDTVKLIRF